MGGTMQFTRLAGTGFLTGTLPMIGLTQMRITTQCLAIVSTLASLDCSAPVGGIHDKNRDRGEDASGPSLEDSDLQKSRRGGASGSGNSAGSGGIADGGTASGGTASGGSAGAGSAGGSAGAVSPACPTFPPETALTVTTMPNVPRPAYLTPVEDRTFATFITRIGDSAIFSGSSFQLNGRSPKPVHHYAKTQAWNSDGTLIMFDGWPAAVLDGKTYKILRSVNPQGEHHNWMNVDPHSVIGVQQPNAVVKLNVMTGQRETLRTFAEYDSISYGGGEGNLSNDDRYMALQAKKGTAVAIVVYDLVANQIVSTLDGQSAYPNNVSMSQSGQYFVVQWNVDGTAQRQGISVHARDGGTFLRNLSDSGGGHADLCYDQAGNEVLVVTEDASPALQMVRLDNGARTQLLTREVMGYNLHISCRNLKKPGWAYISQFAADQQNDAPKAYYQTVFAVKLDGSGKVMRFAHEHHSENGDYERMAFATPNRDGSKVLWRSDWGNANGPVDTYLAEKKCR